MCIFKFPYLLLIGVILLAAACEKSPDPRGFKTVIKSDEEMNIAIFESVSPSVAFIKNAALQVDWFSAEFYEVPRGAGSGFVWDKDGHIVTNFHVLYRADKIDVTLSDQKTYNAKIVGYSPDHDLAVLKVDAPKDILKAIPLGESKHLKVGQKVLSIGNPFGLDYSLTTGVVSALGRSIQAMTGTRIYDAIQTDAAINPGSSGGPLLDSGGQLIGVTTAIYSPSGASAGVGFAIPVDTVKRVVPQLIKYGKVKKVGLGIVLVPDNIRRRLGVDGAMILNILPGGPADKAGLAPTQREGGIFGGIIYGDIITKLDDHPVNNNEDLIEYIEKTKKNGDRIEIKYLRNTKLFSTSATLKDLDEL
ncbi:MAG: S1C family serine protease [Candidatus Omnitrophota bacterium]